MEPWIVTPAEAGQKLFQFLQRRLGKTVPKSAVMRAIRSGQVRVDSKRVKPFVRLAEKQAVRIPPWLVREADTTGSTASTERFDAPLSIVHEDNELLVLNKSAGIPVQPDGKGGDSLQARINAAYKDAEFTPTPAHRIDRATSGLVVCGKTYASLRNLHDLFKSREIEKTYLAWVHGRWPESGTITLSDQLEKHDGTFSGTVTTGSGKDALAKATPLLTASVATLFEIQLLTGRTHQIRVQLASRGFPIVGDRKYDPDFSTRPHPVMLLHSWRLRFDKKSFQTEPDWDAPFALP